MPEAHDPFRGVKPNTTDAEPTEESSPAPVAEAPQTPPAAPDADAPAGDDAAPASEAETTAEPVVEVTATLDAEHVVVPEGTTKEVLAWVGDDKDRAQAALAAEKASDEPRKGLTRELEELLG